MSDDDVFDPAAPDAMMDFLEALASDDPAAPSRAMEKLLNFMGNPGKMYVVLYTLSEVGGRMWATAHPSPGDFYTFEVNGPLGRIPIDQAPPAMRWVGRWFTAAMNGDGDTCLALWNDEPDDEDLANEIVKNLVGALVVFLQAAVRDFIATDRPLVGRSS